MTSLVSINWSGIDSRSLVGRLLRFPLRFLPPSLVVPILSGPNRGFRWRVGALTHGAWLGSFEIEKQRRLSGHLREGMTVFDLGAHSGFYTLLAARGVGPSGKVVAFEPWPPNIEDWRAHMRMNRLTNVEVLPFAVGRADGDVWFEPGPSNSEGRIVDSPAGMRFAAVTLDTMLGTKRCPVPDLIKMDVEGAESAVLEGARTLLREHAPIWFIALHSAEQKRACVRILAEAGYTISGLNGERYDPSSPEAAPDEIIAARPRIY